MRAAAFVLAAALGAGCVTLSWERESRHTPVPDPVLAQLETGRSDLTDCLELLGAPLWVWEHVEGGEPGAALAWGWINQRDLGVRVSVPVSEQFSVSLDYDRIDLRMKGVVLFFDQDLTLRAWRKGLLRDLSREVRRPPTAPAEVLEEEA